MGVCDYVCFVQRNGQTLVGLDPIPREDPLTNAGNKSARKKHTRAIRGLCTFEKEEFRDAVLVRVPKNEYSKADILAWDLKHFAKFKRVAGTYDWDNWDFDTIRGYRGVLMGDTCESTAWWDQAIWESPDFPEEFLVNFDATVFRAFVLGHYDAAQIPWEFFKCVFANRERPVPTTKKQALENIVNCKRENLWEFEGKTLEPLSLSEEYTLAKRALYKKSIFYKDHAYSLCDTPTTLKASRILVLLKDNLADLTGSIETHVKKCAVHCPGGESVYSLEFRPTANVESAFRGCLICKQQRELGSYFCPTHQKKGEKETRFWTRKVEKEIGAESRAKTQIISELCQSTLPRKLVAEFIEKNKEYCLVLEPTLLVIRPPETGKEIADDDPYWDQLEL